MKSVIIVLAILTLAFSANPCSGEVIWLTDRDECVLLKIGPDGKKKLISLKNFKAPGTVAVDSRDGSVWVTDLTETYNNQIMKLAPDGSELFRLGGFVRLGDAAIDPKDGSYYVSELMIGEVVKISSEGKEIFRIKNLSPVKNLEGLGCFNRDNTACHAAYIGTGVNLESIDDVGISPVDGSVWVADSGQRRLLKFTKDGKKIAQKGSIGVPEQVGIGYDGACWVNNIEQGRIFKIAADGRAILAKISGLDTPFEFSLSPVDKTCWATTRSELIQISPDGKKILKRLGGFKNLAGISAVNPEDGSFWMVDSLGAEIVKVSKDGKILKRISGFKRPRFLAVYWNSNN